MFHTLENSWDQSGRRGWTTVASFTMQALAMSLLLLIPLLTIQGPPRLAWFDPHLLAPPPAPPAPAPVVAHTGIRGANIDGVHLFEPSSIPPTIPQIDDRGVQPAPDVRGVGVQGGTGRNEFGIAQSLGDGSAIAPPPPPAPSRPLQVSHWAEGNLIYRVKPNYPPLARQARIQGTVELRAIISKMGTIENLNVVSGHALLVTSAVEAVKQWRYRPYLLNGEPIEVETEITVNFILGGN
jgi:protein TonB